MTVWFLYSQKNKADLIKCSSHQKHNILHSRIKKLTVACLRQFLWGYCNDKCPELISLCKSALNAQAQISLLARGFIHSHRKRTRFLSARLTCMRSKKIFSPEFNKRNLECGHPLAETCIGAYVNQYLHSITVVV